MRYVQAGEQQLVVLEPEHDTLRQLVQQAGFTAKITKEARRVTIEAGKPLRSACSAMSDSSSAR